MFGQLFFFTFLWLSVWSCETHFTATWTNSMGRISTTLCPCGVGDTVDFLEDQSANMTWEMVYQLVDQLNTNL